MSDNTNTELTGKYLVLFREDAVLEGIQALTETEAQTSNALVFSDLGVAVVDAEPAQFRGLSVGEVDSPILAVEPEQIVYAIGNEDMMGYLRGYRDSVNHLVDQLTSSDSSELAQAQPLADESSVSWGLQATKVVNTCASGRGIKVAVLDTGFDLQHPDFLGRKITAKSFIEGEAAQDGHGHGTHCVGTACGPKAPAVLPRYGVAANAEIFVGKVLSNAGSGTDGQILQGIEWAMANGCDIISMSLGSPTRVGDSYSRIYEAIAQRALNRGTLIIAAAGNESRRPGRINPVGRPANCPSIMAVAAIDSQEQIASFSTSGLNPDGGQVDIAGPGVDVYSSWPMPTQYRTISGTSMATPHVAGIAALHAEESGLKGQALWNLLARKARRLSLPSVDVGAGLVQAP
jgi:subtilisin family serine protease